MPYPKVTEKRVVLQAVSPDPFIKGLPALMPQPMTAAMTAATASAR